MSECNKIQIGGTHYGLRKVQHWDFADAEGLNYFLSAATKYIDRWREKNGVVDLKKALHYLQKERELISASPEDVQQACLDSYLDGVSYDSYQETIFKNLVFYSHTEDVNHLFTAITCLEQYIADVDKQNLGMHDGTLSIYVGLFWVDINGLNVSRFDWRDEEERSNAYLASDVEGSFIVGEVTYNKSTCSHTINIHTNTIVQTDLDLPEVIRLFGIKKWKLSFHQFWTLKSEEVK